MVTRTPPVMPFRSRVEVDCPLGVVDQAGQLIKTEQAWFGGPGGFRVFGKFALVFIYQGGGIYRDALGPERKVEAGDMLLIFPDLPHRYGPDHEGRDWHEVYLAFRGSMFEHWLEKGLLRHDRPVFRLASVEAWRRRMVEVIDPQPPVTPQAALVEACRLQHLLADILAAADHPSGDTSLSWLQEARTWLDSGLHPRLVARQMHCSYPTFRRRFAQSAGCSPGQYQARRVIDRACELMHGRRMNDKQIARELGFCDEFHFSRRFKQIAGLSPRAYRQSLL